MSVYLVNTHLWGITGVFDCLGVRVWERAYVQTVCQRHIACWVLRSYMFAFYNGKLWKQTWHNHHYLCEWVCECECACACARVCVCVFIPSWTGALGDTKEHCVDATPLSGSSTAACVLFPLFCLFLLAHTHTVQVLPLNTLVFVFDLCISKEIRVHMNTQTFLCTFTIHNTYTFGKP